VPVPKLFRALNEFLMPTMNTDDVSTLSLSHDGPSAVEDLIGRIADLVLERQSLRAHDAGPDVLEHNRLAIVRAHHSLSRALIARHCAPSEQAA
jgi:hypothetical protein